jgi:hypothetical protein
LENWWVLQIGWLQLCMGLICLIIMAISLFMETEILCFWWNCFWTYSLQRVQDLVYDCYRLIIGEELFAVRLPEDIANNVIMVFSHLLGVALSGLGLVDSEVWLYLCRLVFISYFKQICRISSCWVKLLSGFFYLFKNWALYCMKVMSLKTMEFGSIFVKISNCFTVSLELELV